MDNFFREWFANLRNYNRMSRMNVVAIILIFLGAFSWIFVSETLANDRETIRNPG